MPTATVLDDIEFDGMAVEKFSTACKDHKIQKYFDRITCEYSKLYLQWIEAKRTTRGDEFVFQVETVRKECGITGVKNVRVYVVIHANRLRLELELE